jgi:hypothetical protein
MGVGRLGRLLHTLLGGARVGGYLRRVSRVTPPRFALSRHLWTSRMTDNVR